MDKIDLLNLAKEAKENSYSPYSNFKVGAALLTKDGNVILGTNIENSSYSASICAERVAIFKAISEGYEKEDFVMLAVTSDSNKFTIPCGTCLQVYSELASNKLVILCSNKDLEYQEFTLDELLPNTFCGDIIND